LNIADFGIFEKLKKTTFQKFTFNPAKRKNEFFRRKNEMEEITIWENTDSIEDILEEGENDER